MPAKRPTGAPMPERYVNIAMPLREIFTALGVDVRFVWGIEVHPSSHDYPAAGWLATIHEYVADGDDPLIVGDSNTVTTTRTFRVEVLPDDAR